MRGSTKALAPANRQTSYPTASSILVSGGFRISRSVSASWGRSTTIAYDDCCRSASMAVRSARSNTLSPVWFSTSATISRSRSANASAGRLNIQSEAAIATTTVAARPPTATADRPRLPKDRRFAVRTPCVSASSLTARSASPIARADSNRLAGSFESARPIRRSMAAGNPGRNSFTGSGGSCRIACRVARLSSRRNGRCPVTIS